MVTVPVDISSSESGVFRLRISGSESREHSRQWFKRVCGPTNFNQAAAHDPGNGHRHGGLQRSVVVY